MTRKHPQLATTLAGAEAANLKKFSEAGGLKLSGCLMLAETNF